MRVRETQTLLDALEVFGGESTLVMDGFDDCIVGFLERFGLPEPILVYDS